MLENLFKNNLFIFPFLAAFILTAIITPLSIVFIKKLDIMDDPKKHKHPAIIHKKPVPRGGGIPLYLSIVLASIIFVPLTQSIIILFLAGFIALIIGVLDDKYDLSPYFRFLMNIVTALIVVQNGITIHFITNPFGGILNLDTIQLSLGFLGNYTFNPIANTIAVIWIVWIMNMLNWSKGVDGQMPGIVAISAIVIGILSLRFPLTNIDTLISAKLAFIIAGSCLGFLIYNFYPAKIFPGYGATSAYLMLAAVSILSGAKLATAILVMGIPMADGLFTIARRILSGKSPFWHDKKHLHHLLLSFGFGQRQTALFYWFFSAILGLISLTLSSQGKAFAIVMFLVSAGGLLAVLHYLSENNEKKDL